MSGSAGTAARPADAAAPLDASVTELLALMGGGAAPPTAAPARTGWTDAAKPSKPRGGMSEEEYDAALQAAMPAIQAARALLAISAKAQPAVDGMEDAVNAAATLGGQKNFEGAASALRRATAQVQAAQAAIRDEFTVRHTAAIRKLGTKPARIGALAAAPAAVTAALGVVTTARDAATAASGAAPPNWASAFTELGKFDGAVDPLDNTCLTEAQGKLTSLEGRYNTVNAGKAVSQTILGKYTECNATRKRVATLVARADGLGALEAAEAAEVATAALETDANPSTAVKTQRVADAQARVAGLSSKKLKSLPLLDKAEIAFDLCANKVPTDPDTLKELVRLYNNSPPDKAFLKKREKQRKEIAGKVAAMPELTVLYDKKGKFDAVAWTAFIQDSDNVKGLLESVSHIQADTLGIPRVPINKRPDPPVGRQPNGGLTFGGYNPSTNSVNLNMHPDCLEPADEALGTILHEMFHAHQDFMVRQLKNGEIGPDHPDYATAMMYMVNDIPVGYLFSRVVGHAAYAAQPTEIDAEDQGKAAAIETLALVKKNAKKRK